MKHPRKKKLIEVAVPLDAINAASAREKSIRHGHPSTLHLWWARRPLAACRAVLFAQLVDDPSSHPDKFPNQKAVDVERQRLFDIIEDLVKWENSTNEDVLQRARAEIIQSCGGQLPSIYDPFSGGASIPLEAQRLGMPTHCSDLNPIAVMIGKAMIEIPPRFNNLEPAHPGNREKIHYRNTEGLAEDVKYYGSRMKEKALEKIGHLYPEATISENGEADKAPVIAWIWARTVPSPDPAFSDTQVPIASNFILSSKSGSEVWVYPVVDRENKSIQYLIRKGGTREEIEQARTGTKAGRGAYFRCLLSGAAIPPKYVKSAGKLGKIGQTLIAIIAQGRNGRIYAQPSSYHEAIAKGSTPRFKPTLRISGSTQYLGVKPYGVDRFDQLYTDRQLIALETFKELIHEVRPLVEYDAKQTGFSAKKGSLRLGDNGAKAYSEAVCVYLAFALSRAADFWNMGTIWEHRGGFICHLFNLHAIPIVWDFAEGNPFGSGTGSWTKSCLDWVVRYLRNSYTKPSNDAGSSVQQSDAQSAPIPSGSVISTDPPYYDNIPYADISDFFFCWMKPVLQQTYPEIFDILATPKIEELVAAPHRQGGKKSAELFFLNGMKKAIMNMAEQSSAHYPTTIYYAFKQSEIIEDGVSSTGWATFLQAVIDAGYAVVGTLPIRTERSSRMRAHGSNALANSVVLVCRKRDAAAETLSRAEFIRALKRTLPPAIKELQNANIAPADIPQSAIGPGIGVFSLCRRVLEADDRAMPVKTALQLINRELDDYLNGIQAEFDPETRFALTWFEQYSFQEGDFGVANNIATARSISVESVRNAGIVSASAGKVRILKRDQLERDYDPANDPHFTIWKCSQHLVRALELGGEGGAAMLLKKLDPGHADAAKDLAYCLYEIAANKRRDAAEATAWNGLIAVWPELTRQAESIHAPLPDLQDPLDL